MKQEDPNLFLNLSMISKFQGQNFLLGGENVNPKLKFIRK